MVFCLKFLVFFNKTVSADEGGASEYVYAFAKELSASNIVDVVV